MSGFLLYGSGTMVFMYSELTGWRVGEKRPGRGSTHVGGMWGGIAMFLFFFSWIEKWRLKLTTYFFPFHELYERVYGW